MTGVHRDTIMRLGVKAGQGCAILLDSKDARSGLQPYRGRWNLGDSSPRKRATFATTTIRPLATFGPVARIDAETKLVPSYFVASARNMPNTITFISDLALRLNNRIQLSSDAMNSYSEAIGLVFGEEIDYAQIVTFGPMAISLRRSYE